MLNWNAGQFSRKTEENNNSIVPCKKNLEENYIKKVGEIKK